MKPSDNQSSSEDFDPFAKEQQLKSDSASWDTSRPLEAAAGDIPLIDLEGYFSSGADDALVEVARQLRIACQEVGFFTIVGHQVRPALQREMFEQVRQFHALPLELKQRLLMDRPDWPVGGVGYMPVKNRKLPARAKGNLNEAFIIKCDHKLSMQDNQWPDRQSLPDFRSVAERYAAAMTELGTRLLPVFAAALEMPASFFERAFESPVFRLRMTHYPPMPTGQQDEFGIAPHVDTTFCTILAQDQPGLTIFSERRQQWIRAPMLENAFIVNSGELLRHWSNDRFISVKHFANNNTGQTSRYSVPFFLNANANHVMHCIPSCCGPDNPAKYPPISYAESQAVAQGE